MVKLILIIIGIVGVVAMFFSHFRENEPQLQTQAPIVQKTTQSVTPQATKSAVLSNTNTTTKNAVAGIEITDRDFSAFATMALHILTQSEHPFWINLNTYSDSS